jgi:hypothetical protein
MALPDLGRRGEGWIAIQTALIVLVIGSGWLTGPDWDGAGRAAALVGGAALIAGGIAMFVRAAMDLGRGFVWMAPAPTVSSRQGYRTSVTRCGGQVLASVGGFQASWPRSSPPSHMQVSSPSRSTTRAMISTSTPDTPPTVPKCGIWMHGLL